MDKYVNNYRTYMHEMRTDMSKHIIIQVKAK